MCGCMLMHAAMDHEGHQASTQPAVCTTAQRHVCLQRTAMRSLWLPSWTGFCFLSELRHEFETAECPACGQKVDLTWSACAYCGSPLGEAEKQPAPH